MPTSEPSPCGAALSARCFNGEAGCVTHPTREVLDDYERDHRAHVNDALSHAGIWTEEDDLACCGPLPGEDTTVTRPYVAEGSATEHMSPDHNLFRCKHPDCRRDAQAAAEHVPGHCGPGSACCGGDDCAGRCTPGTAPNPPEEAR